MMEEPDADMSQVGTSPEFSTADRKSPAAMPNLIGAISRPSFGPSIEYSSSEDIEFCSDDFPSFKTIAVKWTKSPRHIVKSDTNDEIEERKKFFDSETCRWIDVDNFAFSNELNHFSDSTSCCEDQLVVNDISETVVRCKVFRTENEGRNIQREDDFKEKGCDIIEDFVVQQQSRVKLFSDSDTCETRSIEIQNNKEKNIVNHRSDVQQSPIENVCDEYHKNISTIQQKSQDTVFEIGSAGDCKLDPKTEFEVCQNVISRNRDNFSKLDSIASSSNDESSLALLDPKYLASVDSTDIFGLNPQYSVEEEICNWKQGTLSNFIPSGSTEEGETGSKTLSNYNPSGSIVEGETGSKNSSDCNQSGSTKEVETGSKTVLTKQYSLHPGYEEDPEEGFRPLGFSSPLPDDDDVGDKTNLPLHGQSSQPKIISPRDKLDKSFGGQSLDESNSKTKKKSMRKLSNDLGSALPSRSDTAKSSDVSHEDDESSKMPNAKMSKAKTKIPRFVRKAQRSHSSCSPVERKLKQQIEQQQQQPSITQSQPPTNRNQSSSSSPDRVAKKLGEKKSHSVANLSKISVKDYHASAASIGESKFTQKSAKKSLSFDSLSRAKSFSNQDLPRNQNKYGHVQSKVRQYIENVNSLKQQSQDSVDKYGRSFVLSPGRKSLSMSNIAASGNPSSRRSSKSDILKMKTFLSSRHLDGVQITISGSKLSQSRESLRSENPQFDNSRISRLLDGLSDDEEHQDHDRSMKNGLKEYDQLTDQGNDVCVYPVQVSSEEDIVLDVEDLLQLALDERQGKQEAKQVLSQLQECYDQLQRKYAHAENIIDKLRFGHADVIEVTDSAFIDPPTAMMSSQNTSFWHGTNNSSLNYLPKPTIVDKTSNVEKLREIQEQLYGLELLSSANTSLTPMEKKKILEHLRISFDEIESKANMSTAYVDGCSIRQDDESLLVLISEVGRKLHLMETRGSFDEEEMWPKVKDNGDKRWNQVSVEKSFAGSKVEINSSVEESNILPSNTDRPIICIENQIEEKETTSIGSKNHDLHQNVSPKKFESQNPDHRSRKSNVVLQKASDLSDDKMDIHEKVSRWRDSNKLSVEEISKKVVSNLPSCYGSCPTSPTTGSGSREALDQTDRPRKSFDFDSGCPGSDRSSRNPVVKSGGPSPSLNLRDHRYPLFNVEEREEKCSTHDKSPIISDRSWRQQKGIEIPDTSDHPNPKLLKKLLGETSAAAVGGRLQRDLLHSVTDLSSDERIENEENISPRCLAAVLPQVSPRSIASQTMTPRGALPILAQQIDQEILELRSLYEGHKEEMMLLINGSEEKMNVKTTTQEKFPTSKSPPKLQRLFASRQATKFCDSESDSVQLSLQEERRLEFQQRRQRQIQRKRILMSKNRGDNFPDPLVPNFVIGSPNISARGKSQAISSFFPSVNEIHAHALGDVVDGQRVATFDGQEIFIPKLNLEELVSESSENFCRHRDPRSFDFNGSLEPHIEVTPPISVSKFNLKSSCCDSISSSRQRRTYITDQGCQVNNNESLLWTDSIRRTVSAGHLDKSDNSSRPIIIVQSCCGGHSVTARTYRSESAMQHQQTNHQHTPHQHTSRHHTPHQHTPEPHDGGLEDQADYKKPRTTCRRRAKQHSELRNLLKSLVEANELAVKLKERSVEMLQIIGQDMKQLT